MNYPSLPLEPGLTRRDLLLRYSAAALSFSLGGWRLARAGEAGRKRVLFFSKSSDYVHEVIFRHGQVRSYAERILAETGPQHGIEFTFSQDGSQFTPEYLSQFDAFCFFTSGDLLEAGHPRPDGHGGDGNRPMTAAGKSALLEAVRNGKGFVGIHSAADTFHAGETGATTPSAGQELQTEYFVPRHHAIEAIFAVERLRDLVGPHLLISEIRAIAADNLWMSPCYHQDCVTLHFTWKPDWPAVRSVLPIIERELAPFQPRPHWGKLFTIPPAQFLAHYPRLPEFIALARQYDPAGKFRNEFLDTNVFGAEARS